MSFKRLETELDDLVLIEPTVHGDERGFLADPVLSDRDRNAPPLAAIAASLAG